MKEAQYKAHLLSKEVESIVKEEEEKNKVMEKTDKREKRSPQKSRKFIQPYPSHSEVIYT